ncbi:MAG: PAS domain S-box protein [Limisphaerales bacterium]
MGATGAGALALTGLVAWWLDRWRHLTLGDDYVPMAPSTAILLLLLSLALWLQTRPSPGRLLHTVEGVCAGVVAGGGLLFGWAGYAGIPLPLESWGAGGLTTADGIPVGRMSPVTAGAFVLIATAYWCGRVTAPFWQPLRSLGTGLAATTLLGTGILLAGYLSDTPFLYGTSTIPMAGLTAAAFVLASAVTLLCSGTGTWPLRMFLRHGTEGGPGVAHGIEWALLVLFLVLTSGITLVGLDYLKHQQTEARAAAREQLEAIADLKVQQIVNWRKERLADAKVIRATPYAIRRALDAMAQPESAITRRMFTGWLDPVLEGGVYQRALLLDGERNVRLVHPPPQAPRELAETLRLAAEEALRTRQVVVADLHRVPNETEVHLDLLVPLVVRREGTNDNVPAAGLEPSPLDRSAGVLVLQIDARDFLFPLVQSWPTRSRSAETLLVRREAGEVLYLSDLRHRPGAAPTLRRSLDEPRLPAATALRGEGGVQEGVDYRGVRVVAVVRAVPETPWLMVAKVDEAELYAPLRRQARSTAVLALALLLAATLGVAVIWRRRQELFLRAQLTVERERHALAERFGHLMKHANDVVLLADDQGRILEVNHRALALYGYSLAELQGMRLSELLAANLRHDPPLPAADPSSADQPTFETLHQRKDGSVLPVEISSRLIEIGGLRYRLDIARDITQRKTHEAALVESEVRYRRLFEAAQDGILILDAETGTIVDVNPFLLRMLGFTHEQLTGQKVWELGFFKDIAANQANFRELQEQEYIRYDDRPLETVDGRRIDVEFVSNVYLVDHHKVVQCNIRDITERKHSEQALRQSEDLLRTIIDSTPDWIFIKDRRHRYVLINQGYADCLGRTPADVLGLNDLELGFPEAQVKGDPTLGINGFWNDDLEVMTSGQPRVIAEDPATVNGQLRLHHTFKAPVRDVTGKVSGVLGIARDITAVRAAAVEVRKLSRAVEQSPALVVITDVKGNIEYVNPRFEQVSGYTLDEVRGRNPRVLKSGEMTSADYAGLWRTITAGGEWTGEFHNRRKDGSLYWERAVICGIRDDAGRITHFLGVKEDITERKRAESGLRRSEALLHHAGEMAHLGAWEVDLVDPKNLNTNILHWSEEIFRVFGYEPNEVVPTRELFYSHVHPDDRARISEAVRHALATGQRYEIEHRIRRRDGAERVVLEQAEIRADANGRPTQMIGALQDVTERKRLQSELVGRERQLNAFFRSATTGMVLFDRNLRYLRVNEAMAELNGLPCEAHVGRTLAEVAPLLAPLIEPILRQVLATGEPVLNVEITTERHGHPGVPRNAEESFFPVAGDQGTPEGVGAVVVDVTVRKRLDAERLAMEAQLLQQQRLESVGTLASGVAHEINNPINGIMNYAQLIQDRLEPGSPLTEFSQEILHETQRVATIVRNLLTFSRNERQSRSPARMVDIIEATLSLIRTVIRRDQISIEVDVPPDLPELRCRSQQIQQVLMNLMTNARDALNERYAGHDPDKILRVEARLIEIEGRQHIRVTVEDHGAGISPAVRQRMFDPFFTTKPRDQGTGLGLSISHGIVKDHRGTLSVESEPGRFTRLHLDLPVEPAAEPPAAD